MVLNAGQKFIRIIDQTGNLTGNPSGWPTCFNPDGHYHHRMTHLPAGDLDISDLRSNPYFKVFNSTEIVSMLYFYSRIVVGQFF